MKLLIADDERIIRDSLVGQIPWAEHGISVFEAADGQQALKMIKEIHPDIVMTDINMPFLTGLELAEQAKALFPALKVIFLTGYDEFDYAKKALQLRASDYILKYEAHERILEAVKKAEEEIRREKDEKRRYTRSQPLLQKRFITDLIMGVETDAQIRKSKELLGFSEKERSYFCSVMEVKWENSNLLPPSIIADEVAELSAMNVCEETVEKRKDDYFFTVYNNQIVVLCCMQPESRKKEELKQVMQSVGENLKQFLNLEVRIGISNEFSQLEDLDIGFNCARMAVNVLKSFHDINIIFAEELKQNMISKNTIVEQINSFINKNYMVPNLSLNDLEQEVHLSASHLCRIIKNSKDTNFMAWLTKVRVSKAEELMRDTDKKMYEICEKVGYNNPQYFSVVFKKHTGLSPMDYKKQFEE